MNLSTVLISPVVTEKTTKSGVVGRYTFRVDRRASRHEIVSAVTELFGVTVAKITTLIRKGERRRRGRKTVTTTSIKLATITLKSGQTIPDMTVTEEKS